MSGLDAEIHEDKLPPEAAAQNLALFEQLADNAAKLLDTDLTAAVRTKIAAAATRATRDFNWSELIILGALIKHAGEIGREAKVNDVLLREPDDD
jgi:hypothetical protein